VIKFLKANAEKSHEIKNKLDTDDKKINTDIYRFKLESNFSLSKKVEVILSFHQLEIDLYKMVQYWELDVLIHMLLI
jgi:hypothetical protein